MSIVMRLYKWFRKRVFKIDDRSQLEIAVANGLKMGSNVHVMGGLYFGSRSLLAY